MRILLLTEAVMADCPRACQEQTRHLGRRARSPLCQRARLQLRSVGEVTTPLMRQVAALSASGVATPAVSNLKGCLRRTERCPIAERGCDTNDERSHDSFDGRVHRSTVTEFVALLAVEVAALLTSEVAAPSVSEGATRSTSEVADPSSWHQLAKSELHR